MSSAALTSPSLFSRIAPALRLRLLCLAVGNLLLVGYIFGYTWLTPNTSFAAEMSQFPAGAAPLLLAGLGLTGIVYTGGIDLSIGSIVVMCGTVFGILFERGFPPGVCFAGCWLTAVVLSSLNGWLIRWLSIPGDHRDVGHVQILSRLRAGARALARCGILRAVLHPPSGRRSLSRSGRALGGLDSARRRGDRDSFGMLRQTSPALARGGQLRRGLPIEGLNPQRHQTIRLSASGVFLGLGALIFVTKGLTIEPDRMAQNFELQVIGAVVLGGTNIFGGEGSYLGTLLGGCLLYFIDKAILYAGISEYWQIAVQGALILAVIGLDCVLHRKRKLMEELR